MLTAEEEMTAAGWVLHRHELLVDTSSARFYDFLSRAFNTRPSPAWLTKFKRRWLLSSILCRRSTPTITPREDGTLSTADARVASKCIRAYAKFKDLTSFVEPDEAEAEMRLPDTADYHVRHRRAGQLLQPAK